MAKTRRKISNQNFKRAARTVLLFIIFLPLANGYAQSPAAYNLAEIYDFNVKTVYSLYQAKNKHVWLGTDQGLFEFDGTVFRKYRNSKYQTEYSNIQEDSEGRIWCNNFSGQIFYTEQRTLKLFKDVNEYAYNDGGMIYMFTTIHFPKIYIGTDYGCIVADFYDKNNNEHLQAKYHTKKEYKVLQNKDTIYKDNIHLTQPYKNIPEYFKIIINLLQKDSTKLSFPIRGEDSLPFLFSRDDKFFFLFLLYFVLVLNLQIGK